MTTSAQLRSGKGAADENFPVASWIIQRRHRRVILAFYEFVRVADDIADHGGLSEHEKMARLERLEKSLLGRGEDEPVGLTLRAKLERRGLTARHALDLLKAFKQDVTKRRYVTWDELMDYCSRSALPVGRFVLDVHGETRATWPASDALCAALQIINHLQDCATDYCTLDRVYIPLHMLKARGTGVEALGASHSSAALLDCLHALAGRTAILLQKSRGLSESVSDRRLALEVSIIQALAERLVAMLKVRDPLKDVVHLTRSESLAIAAHSGINTLLYRLFRVGALMRRYETP